MTNKHSAFTMIELLVALLITSILIIGASVAYNGYALKVRMAEAYTMLDFFTKSEISYFLSHKRNFKSFVMPSESPGNTTPFAPSGGSKIKVDYASRQYSPFSIRAWEDVGAPFHEGDYAYFFYRGLAGRLDAAGNPYQQEGCAYAQPCAGTNINTNPFGSTPEADYGLIPLKDDPHHTFCSTMHVAVNPISGPMPSETSWVRIEAWANLKVSKQDQWSSSNAEVALCTSVVKYIQTGPSGNIDKSIPFIITNPGS